MPEWLVKLLQDNDGKLENFNQLDKQGVPRRSKLSPNMADGIIPVIAHLLEQDTAVAYAYMCDPTVKHISKLMKEGEIHVAANQYCLFYLCVILSTDTSTQIGGFCGYRNIQMLTSYITGAQSQGHEILDRRIPSIFDIQEYIETAWDNGINAQGRIETGGVRGTRKYIGTSEVFVIFSFGFCRVKRTRAS